MALPHRQEWKESRAMTRKPAKQRSLREAYQASQDATNFYAAMAGKPPVDLVGALPAKRAYKARGSSGEPTEAQILKAIMQLLKKHPMVAKVWRQNSGTAQYQYGAKTSYVRFNTAKGMSDIMGILKDGRTLCIETKSRTGKVQPHQQAFLDSINAAGGLAFVARSTDDVINKLRENDNGRQRRQAQRT